MPLAALDRLGKKALRNEVVREEFITKARALFPNLSKEQFIETLKKSNRATYLTSLVNQNCSSRIRTDDLEMTFSTKTNTKKFGKGNLNTDGMGNSIKTGLYQVAAKTKAGEAASYEFSILK